jgi:hypothetical protein
MPAHRRWISHPRTLGAALAVVLTTSLPASAQAMSLGAPWMTKAVPNNIVVQPDPRGVDFFVQLYPAYPQAVLTVATAPSNTSNLFDPATIVERAPMQALDTPGAFISKLGVNGWASRPGTYYWTVTPSQDGVVVGERDRPFFVIAAPKPAPSIALRSARWQAIRSAHRRGWHPRSAQCSRVDAATATCRLRMRGPRGTHRVLRVTRNDDGTTTIRRDAPAERWRRAADVRPARRPA